MNCTRCNANIGSGGVEQEDGVVFCLACDQAESSAFSLDGPPAENNLEPEQSPRELRAALLALAAYGKKKSPTIRSRAHAERAARSGSDGRAMGAGLAILGAVDDDPYLFSAGLHINQSGQIAGARAEAHALAGGPRRVTPVDPALTRMLAERSETLTRQPIRSKAAATRWLDTVAAVQVEPDGTIHGRLSFVHLNARRDYDLTFDDAVGMWTVDLEADLRQPR